ncbi:KIR-like protein [Plasmodium coatneyi]|uniref:KIR-like protein n=1 Tax=Plasmodium coatneyi TaxID=208452 RepID=A0A1B1E6F6_9APIC|nr:KIR-like protein [Plasmodium coatneyi]ANQ10563.1 KIR-like protein [Plasmodium coatneyi]
MGSSCSDKIDLVQNLLGSEFDELENHKQELRKIIHAWCNIPKSSFKEGRDTLHCQYFYYWLGGTISRILEESSSFPGVISKIYEILPTIVHGEWCRNLCPGIRKEEFGKLKNVYDYYQDYSQIKSKVSKIKDECNGGCRKYLEGIKDDYVDMRSSCLVEMEKKPPYCSVFGGMFGRNSSADPKEPLKLLSKLGTQAECPISTEGQEVAQPNAVNTNDYTSLSTQESSPQAVGQEGKGGTLPSYADNIFFILFYTFDANSSLGSRGETGPSGPAGAQGPSGAPSLPDQPSNGAHNKYYIIIQKYYYWNTHAGDSSTLLVKVLRKEMPLLFLLLSLRTMVLQGKLVLLHKYPRKQRKLKKLKKMELLSPGVVSQVVLLKQQLQRSIQELFLMLQIRTL